MISVDLVVVVVEGKRGVCLWRVWRGLGMGMGMGRMGRRRFVFMWVFCSRGFIMGVGFGLVGREGRGGGMVGLGGVWSS